MSSDERKVATECKASTALCSFKEHAPYEKMAESCATWAKMPSCEWVVTEKVHGANICFVSDGVRVKVAKRRGFISKDDSFFGFRPVAVQQEPKVLQLVKLLRGTQPEASMVWVYGELFGGGYPHEVVPAVKHLEAVQTGVWYSPDLRFTAFDVAYTTPGASSRVYLDFAEAVALLRTCKIPTHAPLAITSWATASEYCPEFTSTIPATLGLPPLKDNKAEGVVIRAAKESLFRGLGFRPLLKIKSTRFSEKKYHNAVKATRDSVGFASGGASPFQQLDWAMRGLMNEARLAAAVSKIGPLHRDTPTVNREVLTELVDDVMTELSCAGSEYRDLWESLLSDERRKLRKLVSAAAKELIVAKVATTRATC